MSKQLQLRRGTTNANNLFVGAEGELTMDTTTKGLRVHDGTTVGGFKIDTVVMFQAPTPENGYTWARKYSSGWVEQGGRISVSAFTLNSGSTTMTAAQQFPVALAATPTIINVSDNMTFFNCHHQDVTSTELKIKISSQLSVSYSQGACEVMWEVKGMAA